MRIPLALNGNREPRRAVIRSNLDLRLATTQPHTAEGSPSAASYWVLAQVKAKEVAGHGGGYVA